MKWSSGQEAGADGAEKRAGLVDGGTDGAEDWSQGDGAERIEGGNSP